MIDTQRSSMLEVLGAGGPAADRAADMMLYSWLIGSWDVEVLDRHPDGAPRPATGEWHFGWILEGRAIQDVFIVPRRAERTMDGTALAGNRYGTTLRVFNPADGTWRIDWTNPVTQARNSMIARKAGAEIVQDGLDAEDGVGRYRWIFSEITPNAFRWRAEVSSDGGRSWQITVAFRATRSAAR